MSVMKREGKVHVQFICKGLGHELGKKTTTAITTPKSFLFIGETVNSGENIRKSMTFFRIPITCTRTIAVEFLFEVWMIVSKPNPQSGNSGGIRLCISASIDSRAYAYCS